MLIKNSSHLTYCFVIALFASGITVAHADNTPAVAAQYDSMQQSLQQIMRELSSVQQENALLEQRIEQALQANQKLDAEIEKIRPEVATTPDATGAAKNARGVNSGKALPASVAAR